MFSFKKRNNYEEQIREYLNSSNLKNAEKVAREAFADEKTEEHLLAWVASSMYERGVNSTFDLLEKFVSLYPESLHLPRVYLADVLSRASRFDQATDYSRYYLRIAGDSGVFSELATKRILQEGVSRSFLLLTSAYTTLGARSYSKRVLNYGLKYELSEKWAQLIRNEISQLNSELQQNENVSIDKKWENFFSTGIGANELYSQCIEAGFPLMAKRIDLLEGNFRFNSSFSVNEHEILLLVFESKNNVFLLR